MFKSIKDSIIFNPKKYIASYISKTLAEYFDVDPTLVETNLIVDAHVLLKNVKFKPFQLSSSPSLAKNENQGEEGSTNANKVVVLHGIVEFVEFSWKWGSGDSVESSFITDVTLTIRGAKFHLSKVDASALSSTHQHPTSLTNASTNNNNRSAAITSTASVCDQNKKEDWRSKYLQQIIDNLTLHITDMDISVDLPQQQEPGVPSDGADNHNTTSSILLQATSIEIITLGRLGKNKSSSNSNKDDSKATDDNIIDESALSQRMSIGSLAAYVTIQSNNKEYKYPLLDPLTYKAQVKRVSGRRFVDGIGAGLIITGERFIMDGIKNGCNVATDTPDAIAVANKNQIEIETRDSIRLHIGNIQIEALLRLQSILSIVNSAKKEEGKQQQQQQQGGEGGGGVYATNKWGGDGCYYTLPTPTTTTTTRPLATTTITTTEQNDLRHNHCHDSTKSSRFILPIKSVSLVLNNNTEIMFNGCTVLYCTDGTEMKIDCWPGSGILVDNKEFVSTTTTTNVSDEKNHRGCLGRCIVDLVQSSIQVNPYSNNKWVDKKESSRIRSSSDDDFFDAMTSEGDEEEKQESESVDNQQSPLSSLLPSLPPPIVARVTISIEQTNKMALGCKELLQTINKHTNKYTKIDEVIVEQKDQNQQTKKGSSPASSSSWSLNVNGTIAFRLNNEDRSDDERWLEGYVQKPRISLASENMDLLLVGWDNIRIGPSSFGNMAINVPNAISMRRNGKAALIINSILDVSFQSMGVVHEVKNLVCDLVDAVNVFGDDVKDEKTTEEKVGDSVIIEVGESSKSGLPVQFMSIPEIQIRISSNREEVKEAGSIHVKDVECLGGLVWNCTDISINGFGMDGLSVRNAELDLKEKTTKISIEQISNVLIPEFGYFVEPVKSTVIEIEDDVLRIDTKSISVFLEPTIRDYEARRNIDDPSGSMVTTLPFTFQLTTQKMVAKISSLCTREERNECFIQCDNVKLNVKPARDSSSGSVNFACSALDVRGNSGASSVSFGGKGLSICTDPIQSFSTKSATNASSILPFFIPGVGELCSASFKISEVSKLDLSKVGCITTPIENVAIDINDEVLSVVCTSIEFTQRSNVNCTGKDENENKSIESGSSFWLPLRTKLILQSIVIKANDKRSGQLIRGEVIDIDLQPAMAGGLETVELSSANAQFGTLEVFGPMQAYLYATDIKVLAMLGATTKVGQENIRSLISASLEIEEVRAFCIPGVGRLSEAMKKMTLLFEDNVLCIKCGVVELMKEGEQINGDTDNCSERNYVSTTGRVFPFSIEFAAQSVGVKDGLQSVECVGIGICVSLPCENEETHGNVNIKCSTLQWNSDYGIAAIAGLDVEAPLGLSCAVASTDDSLLYIPGIGTISGGRMRIDAVTELNIKGIGSLAAPLCNSIVVLEEQNLCITCTSIELTQSTFPETKASDDSDGKSINRATTMFDNLPPWHVRFVMQSIFARSKESGYWLKCNDFDLRLGAVTTISRQTIYVKCLNLQGYYNDCEATFLGLNVEAFFVSNASKENFSVYIPGFGLLTKGTITIDEISALDVPDVGNLAAPLRNSFLHFEEEKLRIDCTSIELIKETRLQKSVAPVVDTDAATVATSFLPPCPIQLVVQSLSVKRKGFDGLASQHGVKCNDLVFSGRADRRENTLFSTNFRCKNLKGSTSDTSVAIVGLSIEATLTHESTPAFLENELVNIPGICNVSTADVAVQEITKLSISGIGSLSEPMLDTSIRFQNNAMLAECGNVEFFKAPPTVVSTNSTNARLPLPVQIRVQTLHVRAMSLDGVVGDWLRCRNLDVSLSPSCISNAIRLAVNQAFDTEYVKMLKVPSLAASALLHYDRLDTLCGLTVEVKKAELSADFSSVSWSQSLEDCSNLREYSLPFAYVSELDVELKFEGNLVSVDATKVNSRAFVGDENTTSSSLTNHYTKIVKQRLPHLLTNANIAGTNVGDSIGVFAGQAALSSVAPVGAVVGIGAKDGITAAISAGKKSRGAKSSEKYQFGDFTRGLIAAAKSDKSASAATGIYLSENRVRLGGAGGASAGMIAGAAVAGPIGMVAGAIMAGRATSEVIRATTGDPATSKQKEQRRIEHSNGKEIMMHSSNPPDLLLSNSPTVSQASAGDTSSESVPSRDPFTTIDVFGTPGSGRRGAHVATRALNFRPSSEDLPLGLVSANTPANPHHQEKSEQQYPNNDLLGFSEAPMTPHTSCSPNRGYCDPPSSYKGTPSIVQGNSTQQQQRDSFRSNARAEQESAAKNLNDERDLQRYPKEEQTQQQKGYKFGDLTRSVIAKGKKKSGRNENSGYKFGDFTRGLFG